MGRHVCPEDCELHKICIGPACECRKQDGRPTSCYPCRLAKTACRPGLRGGGMCGRCLRKGSPHHCNRRGGEGAQGEGRPADRHGPQYPVDFGPNTGEALLAGGMEAPSPILQQPTPPESVRSASNEPGPVLFLGSTPPPLSAPTLTPAPFRPNASTFPPPASPDPTVSHPVPGFSPAAALPFAAVQSPAAGLSPAFAPSVPAPISSDRIFSPFASAPQCDCPLRLTRAKDGIEPQLAANNHNFLVRPVLLAEQELVDALSQVSCCVHCFERYKRSQLHLMDICRLIMKGVAALTGRVLPKARWLKPEEKGDTLQVLLTFIAFLRQFGEREPAVGVIGSVTSLFSDFKTKLELPLRS
ncbi:hypothetical protein SMACR_03131 [Sordaria macrospora]|uniref:Uncharacterized protein n=1 Tax=Sordaria macrospora TaxID=5147 RepID=A0A8S8ZUB7_SORMA|nr:hypothetical protein SMACR_03131 [Sordaria macrospora]KAH7632831.1 hypothetical protein B0T09DRAFT_81002 [Sordaria sp. MPI-SDFR-AT-0083]WPJ60698.1 hypothetical protein SMAC4_03131 [Sordaria macrospora]